MIQCLLHIINSSKAMSRNLPADGYIIFQKLLNGFLRSKKTHLYFSSFINIALHTIKMASKQLHSKTSVSVTKFSFKYSEVHLYSSTENKTVTVSLNPDSIR